MMKKSTTTTRSTSTNAASVRPALARRPLFACNNREARSRIRSGFEEGPKRLRAARAVTAARYARNGRSVTKSLRLATAGRNGQHRPTNGQCMANGHLLGPWQSWKSPVDLTAAIVAQRCATGVAPAAQQGATAVSDRKMTGHRPASGRQRRHPPRLGTTEAHLSAPWWHHRAQRTHCKQKPTSSAAEQKVDGMAKFFGEKIRDFRGLNKKNRKRAAKLAKHRHVTRRGR